MKKGRKGFLALNITSVTLTNAPSPFPNLHLFGGWSPLIDMSIEVRNMEHINKSKYVQIAVVCAFVITAFGFIAATVFKYELSMMSLGAGTAIWVLAVLLAYKGKRFWPDICIAIVGTVLSLGLLIGQIRSYNDLSGAVGRGDSDRIKALISKGYDVNAHTSGGQTLLTWAFWYPYPNKTIWKDDMPLLILTPQEKEDKVLQVIEVLLDNGANINAIDGWGDAPIHLAVSGDRARVVEMLLHRGADVNMKNGHGDTPLIVAVEANDIEMTTLLMQNGAKIDAGGANGKTPLQIAVEQGKTDIAQYLRQHGAKE